LQDLEERRGKRRRLTKNAIERQKRLAKLAGIGPAHKHNGQDHRFAKMHALNCGIPSCPMCGNPRKVWGERTIQEKRFMQGDCDE
jgi:hypothetical protein